MKPAAEKVSEAQRRLDAWVEKEAFKGWDPYDALNSPLLRRLTRNDRRLGQVWVQLLKRSPVNLRPLLRVPKGYNPKGMGLFLASYWRKYLLSGDEADSKGVDFFADWLRSNISAGYSGACWGYNFPWPNRGFFAPANTPTIVNTAFIGLAFVDLLALCEARALGQWSSEALVLARSACDFILGDLNRTRSAADEVCFSYTPLDHRFVHNANVMGAWLLAEVGVRTSESALTEMALAAARYTTRRQCADGAWLYGEEPYDRWIDNFHTGFVLVALYRIGQALRSTECLPAIERGYAYWKEKFFTTGGLPKYYPHKLYPLDIHCAAQAIITYLSLAGLDQRARISAERVANWAIDSMQDRDGWFHFQVYRTYRIRIPYIRWAQAWMQRALVELEWGRAN